MSDSNHIENEKLSPENINVEITNETNIADETKKVEESVKEEVKKVEKSVKEEVKKVEESVKEEVKKVEESVKEEVKKVEEIIKDKTIVNSSSKISDLLKNNLFVNELLSKELSLNLDAETNIKIINIIKFLTTEVKNNIPLNNILNDLQEIFSDGKLDSYDIPIIIKIITNVVNNNSKNNAFKNITLDDFGIVIKLILLILVEAKIIDLYVKGTNDVLTFDKNIFRMIDSSLELLKISVNIIDVKKCCWCK